jgi:hypothetical protein
MRGTILLALCAMTRVAAADDPAGPDPDDEWRQELSIGGCFGGRRLLHQELSPGGLCVAGGMRNHKLAITGDYRLLSVTWPGGDTATALAAGVSGGADPSQPADGTMQRFGVAARYNLLTLGSGSGKGDMGFFHEFFEAFAEGGVGVERIAWDGGGEYTRADLAIGGGVRAYGIRITDHRTVGIMVRVTDLLSRIPHVDTTPTCVAPCTAPTAPNAWDRGIMVSISLVVST